MKPRDTAFALALLAEHSRNSSVPDPSLLWWLVDSVGAAVRDGISVDQALGIRDGGKSVIRSARLLSRNACILEARKLLPGSDRAAAAEIAGRVGRLAAGGEVRDEADGLLLLAVERGCPEGAEAIRKILRS